MTDIIRAIDECYKANRVSSDFDIAGIMDFENVKDRIKTLLHETAHAYDFAMNPDDDIPRNRRELIAESVAFVVSMRLGLDTSSYSMGYIQSWLKDKDELKIIADTVQKVSYKIIATLAESEGSAFSDLRESEE